MLRRASRCERKQFTIAPIPRVGVMSGSYAGISSLIGSNHENGTGGLDHDSGSDSEPEYDGITTVASSPTARWRARTTACSRPATQPILLSEEWTSSVVACRSPRESKSRDSEDTVAGDSVRRIRSSSFMGTELRSCLYCRVTRRATLVLLHGLPAQRGPARLLQVGS